MAAVSAGPGPSGTGQQPHAKERTIPRKGQPMLARMEDNLHRTQVPDPARGPPTTRLLPWWSVRQQARRSRRGQPRSRGPLRSSRQARV